MKQTTINTTEIKLDRQGTGFIGGSLVLKHCPHNCKLTYLSSINNFLYDLREAKLKQDFDDVLKQCRIAVYLNTNSIPVKDWILKNYELYSLSQIPIGYGKGYQYHIIIRNSIGQVNPNMRPTEFNKEEVVVSTKTPTVIAGIDDLTKTKIKENLVKILKKRRRKTDIVDEIVNSL